MKTFCTNCVNFAREKDLEFYSDINFIDCIDSNINDHTALCRINMTRKIEINSSPIEKIQIVHVEVSDPWILNKDNNCKHFKPTFFVKLKRIIFKE